jgi:hypothetical protein
LAHCPVFTKLFSLSGCESLPVCEQLVMAKNENRQKETTSFLMAVTIFLYAGIDKKAQGRKFLCCC